MIFAAGLCYGKIMSGKKGLFWFQRFHLRLAFLVLRGLNDIDLGCSSENSFFLPSFKRMNPLKNTTACTLSYRDPCTKCSGCRIAT